MRFARDLYIDLVFCIITITKKVSWDSTLSTSHDSLFMIGQR